MKLEKPSLFNALNHTTLEIGRPGALEAPLLCTNFRTTADYLAAWSAWYGKLDEGRLPRAEAEKIATKVLQCFFEIVRIVCPNLTSPHKLLKEYR